MKNILSIVIVTVFSVLLSSCAPDTTSPTSNPSPTNDSRSAVKLKSESTIVLDTGYNKTSGIGGAPTCTQCFFVSDNGEDIYICDIINQDILHYNNNTLMNKVHYGMEGTTDDPRYIAVISDLYYVLMSHEQKLYAIEKNGKIRKEYSLPLLDPHEKKMTLTEKGLFLMYEPGRWGVIQDDTILDTGAPYRYIYKSSSTDEKVGFFNFDTKKEVELEISGDPGIHQIRDYKNYSLIKMSYFYQAEDGTMQSDQWLCLFDNYGVISKIQIPESLKSDESIHEDIFALPNGNVYKLRLIDDRVEVSLIATINE